MGVFVDRAIDAAGLSPVAFGRGDLAALGASPAAAAALRSADLLALGALADRVRREEVGDEVLVSAPPPASDPGGVVVLPAADSDLMGLELLREVAIARITGPRGARVRVDWSRAGLEIAQVALGFGASELSGHLVTKAGREIGADELLGVGKKSRQKLAALVKREELAGLIARAGRVAVFAGEGAPEGRERSDRERTEEERPEREREESG
jgi:hypothetical protein